MSILVKGDAFTFTRVALHVLPAPNHCMQMSSIRFPNVPHTQDNARVRIP